MPICWFGNKFFVLGNSTAFELGENAGGRTETSYRTRKKTFA